MSTPARTTSDQVKAILGPNFDAKKKPDLSPFIRSASNIVDVVKTLSLKKSRVVFAGGLTVNDLISIETWLAAHFYCIQDPLYMSRSTQGATGSFQRAGAKDGFASTDYGKQALDADWSGVLVNINLKQFATMLLPAEVPEPSCDGY